MHYVTATAIDVTGTWPVRVEVHLAESDGSAAVILGHAPLLDIGDVRGSRLPTALDLRCDVVGRDDDHTVLIRLGHGATDRRGRDTFRVAAEAVRSETPGEIFERLLLNYHVDPHTVTDVESAWLAFTEFVQTGFDGLGDDGFRVQWGRYSWADRTAMLSFARQFTLPAPGGPALWQVSLDMRFAGFHTLATGDTGFDHTPPGPARAAALAAVRATVSDNPHLYDLWRAVPRHAALTFDRAA
ncbi:hypothetical protein Aph02nite_47270 [Actinoplanes philippinensis]|uniref:hypothetical protein n=1 Tax=Actinoplanes philippinensis TaxID=35752 RepID=UPI00116020D0|nr:hypothetical protein [Actinoplanes philippinensis]GIE78777.1 hypothetical protein Aph02nite_47270 [Actinoplanes philippinensis]